MTTELAELLEQRGTAALLATAYESGLIDSLADSAPAVEHARRLQLDPEATRLALEALVAIGMAREREGRFGVAEPANGLWSHLPVFLRTGEPCSSMDGSADERAAAYKDMVPTLGRLFQDAARTLAAELKPLGGSILDVGAGSGVWSLAMCERSSLTRVTAVDLPDVLPAFLARARELDLADRVATIAGDYQVVELPAARFDRVVLANVLHLETPDDARALIARVAPAIRRGGELVVIDALAEGEPAAVRPVSLYAIHLAMRTTAGRVHSRAEIEHWCREAGLRSGRLITPRVAPRLFAALIHRAP
jgi:ubiquinone/menaquinone biosynthesis C-methylase UbiE